MKETVLGQVNIIDIADKGRGIGRHDGKAVFVEGAVPGDVVDVTVYKRSKSFDEGRRLEIITPSPDRIEPACSHFGICGGCKRQNMDYAAQLRYKEKVVDDAMRRIGGFSEFTMHPILGSKNTEHYRNKLEFTFTNWRYLLKEEMLDEGPKQMNGLGFHIPGKFNKVLNVDECWLQDTRSGEIRRYVRNQALKHGYTFYNLKNQGGLLRNLVIRNTTLDEWMVVVVFGENQEDNMQSLLDSIRQEFPWINSLQYVVNTKRNDSLHDQTPILHSGQDHICEQLEQYRFRIGPKSFFQTNSEQALELYRITRNYANLTGGETVYDLYTGTGSIACFVSANANKVVGVEYVKEAIDDALLNANLNGINNTLFFAGDMKDVLTKDFIETHGKPDVIITDPPRAGMHPDVVTRILESGADRIVYVSCNPATQARDLILLASKYDLVEMQPVDMFPHTDHVENVALLRLKLEDNS
ncbi:MAG: 23S rRNA (uracil(1939)-C(5))-methyltransferase RlmD [Bacteroidota bacterium]